VIGIDVGISVLMAENQRTQFVWNTFMKNLEVQSAMQQAGFHSTLPSSFSEKVEGAIILGFGKSENNVESLFIVRS
jgi:hypothetical protein